MVGSAENKAHSALLELGLGLAMMLNQPNLAEVGVGAKIGLI